MKKIFKVLLCILMIPPVLASCSKSSKRINDLTIVQALSVDSFYNKTKIGIQYLNLFAGSASTEQLQGNITSVSEGVGKNLSSAAFDVSKRVSDDIFFNQNKLIVFGLDYAQKDIDNAIDYLTKSYDSRPDVLAAIGLPDGETIIKSKECKAKIPAENIFNLLRTGEQNGHAPAVTVCDLLNLYNDETSDIFFPVLSAEKDNVKCEGTAVFSADKYSAMLNEEETLGFLIVKNRFESGTLTFNVENLGVVSAEITSSNAKRKVIIKDGKIIFDIKIKTKSIVNETGKSIKNSLSENDYKEIKKQCEIKINSLCKKAVEKCFENKSDPFMCARYLYLEDKDAYNSLKADWRDNLRDIDIIVHTKTTLQRINNNTAR